MQRALLVLVLGFTGVATAAPVSLRYVTVAGAGCPDEAVFRTLIAARLGGDPFTDNAAALVSVELRPPAAVVLLEEPRGTVKGRKQLEGTGSCDALAASAAVTVALSIDPLLRRAEPVPVVTEPPPPPAPALSQLPPLPQPPPLESVAPPASESSSVEPWRWSLAAGGGVSAGSAVTAQPLLRVEGRVRSGLVSLSLDGRFGWPVSQDLGMARLSTSTLLAAVAPCLHVGWFSGCAEVGAGVMWLEGTLVDAPERHTVFQTTAGLRAQLEIPLGASLALRPFLEGAVNLFRAAANVGDARVWTAAPLVGGGGLALVVNLSAGQAQETPIDSGPPEGAAR